MVEDQKVRHARTHFFKDGQSTWKIYWNAFIFPLANSHWRIPFLYKAQIGPQLQLVILVAPAELAGTAGTTSSRRCIQGSRHLLSRREGR